VTALSDYLGSFAMMSALLPVIFAAFVLASMGSRRRDVSRAQGVERTPFGSDADMYDRPSSLLSTKQYWGGWSWMLPLPLAIHTTHNRPTPATAPYSDHSRSKGTRLHWRNAASEWHQSGEKSHGITEAIVDCVHHGSTVVLVPDTWAESLQLGAIDNIEVFRNSPTSERFRSQLRCDPGFRVEIVGRKSSDPESQRELFVSRRLASAQRARGLLGGHSLSGVAPVLDSAEIGEWTFVMRGLGDGDFEEHIMRGIFHPQSSTPKSEVEFGLLALIGILRGLRTLAHIGIIHNGISFDRLAFNQDRPFIYDLSTACLIHDGDVGFRCCDTPADRGPDVLPAHYRAPEMTEGCPTGPENDMWAAGMFFLEMCSGAVPARTALFDTSDDVDLDDEGLDLVREFAKGSLDLRDIGQFLELPKSIQALTRGMLANDPSKRWTATVALKHALAAAKEVGLTVPEEQGLRLWPDACTVFA